MAPSNIGITTKHYKEMQAGHWIPQAQGNACRYLDDNVWVQCYRCNVNLGGNGPEYSAFMEYAVGKERMNELRQLSKTTKKFTVDELRELEDENRRKIDEL